MPPFLFLVLVIWVFFLFFPLVSLGKSLSILDLSKEPTFSLINSLYCFSILYLIYVCSDLYYIFPSASSVLILSSKKPSFELINSVFNCFSITKLCFNYIVHSAFFFFFFFLVFLGHLFTEDSRLCRRYSIYRKHFLYIIWHLQVL